MDNNQISVTTVSLNAGNDIESTINSILNQSFTDYEYLIIDGGSVDATIEIAKRYTKNFLEKGISYRIISEKDEGIYDAMNKAAKYANGEWIIYINAGDALFDSTVLERLSSEIADDLDVIYGDAVLLDHNKYKLLKAKSLEFFKYSNPIFLPIPGNLIISSKVSGASSSYSSLNFSANFFIFFALTL